MKKRYYNVMILVILSLVLLFFFLFREETSVDLVHKEMMYADTVFARARTMSSNKSATALDVYDERSRSALLFSSLDR